MNSAELAFWAFVRNPSSGAVAFDKERSERDPNGKVSVVLNFRSGSSSPCIRFLMSFSSPDGAR